MQRIKSLLKGITSLELSILFNFRFFGKLFKHIKLHILFFFKVFNGGKFFCYAYGISTEKHKRIIYNRAIKNIVLPHIQAHKIHEVLIVSRVLKEFQVSEKLSEHSEKVH